MENIFYKIGTCSNHVDARRYKVCFLASLHAVTLVGGKETCLQLCRILFSAMKFNLVIISSYKVLLHLHLVYFNNQITRSYYLISLLHHHHVLTQTTVSEWVTLFNYESPPWSINFVVNSQHGLENRGGPFLVANCPASLFESGTL